MYSLGSFCVGRPETILSPGGSAAGRHAPPLRAERGDATRSRGGEDGLDPLPRLLAPKQPAPPPLMDREGFAEDGEKISETPPDPSTSRPPFSSTRMVHGLMISQPVLARINKIDGSTERKQKMEIMLMDDPVASAAQASQMIS